MQILQMQNNNPWEKQNRNILEQFPSENAATKTFFYKNAASKTFGYVRFKLGSKQMQSGRKFREKTN